MYLDDLEKKASNGDSTSMYALAVAYEEGRYTEIDIDKALTWYERAADLGDKFAQVTLATILRQEGSYSEMNKWLERAAAQNHVLAQFRLGYSWELGLAGKVNYDLAEYWYRRAAMRGDSESHFRLGLLYHRNRCFPPDEGASIRCFRRAANLGHLVALAYLGEYYEQGRFVIRNYQKAVDCYRRSARGGFAGAQFCLGQLLQCGLGVERSDEEGAWWIAQAADQGFCPAVYLMCMLSLEGRGIALDLCESCKWLIVGLNLGDPLGPTLNAFAFELEELCRAKATDWQWDEGEKRARLWLDKYSGIEFNSHGFYMDR